MICNKNGENLTDKYIGHKEWEVTPALVDAMVKEVAAGNGPLTVDLAHPDEVRHDDRRNQIWMSLPSECSVTNGMGTSGIQ